MITLYHFRNSVCCQKVCLVMKEKDLRWTPIEVNLFKNQQYDPAYLKLNPAGVVPTLVNEHEVVIESTLICEYLEEVFPDPPLMPRAPSARSQARCWTKMVDEGLHEGVSEISFSAMFRERMKSMSPEDREIRFRNVGDPRRRDRFKSTFDLGAHSPFVAYGAGAFDRAFKRLENTLADGRPWIMGHGVTLADIALMPYVARLHFLNLLPLWIEDRPEVQSWWSRVQEWPSYQSEIIAPMADNEKNEMSTYGPSIRTDLQEILARLRDGKSVGAAAARGAA
jgi:glutathione S-transferase